MELKFRNKINQMNLNRGWYHLYKKVHYEPHERFYRVTGQLYAGVYPGDCKPKVQKQKLTWLLDQGVDRFINLMEPKEGSYSGQFVDYKEALFTMAAKRKLQVTVIRIPIRDMGIPTRNKMIKILNLIDYMISCGRTVYIHCLGGYGRTGTVIGCWLARHNIATGYDVLDYLDHLRGNDPTGQASPQTIKQVDMVTKWKPLT